MDYSIYRFEAVVDFIEIEIHTSQKHLGGVLQKRCAVFGFSHFTPVKANDGGWASTFRIRLYDLKKFAALESKIASIEEVAPFASRPTITRIEVAFDGYLKNDMQDIAGAGELLAKLAARMAYRNARPVSENHRIYHDYKGSPEAMPRRIESLERKMRDGWNVGIGNKSDAQYQHGYLKTTDRNQQLPLHLQRARFEIRIAGADQLNPVLESWAEFKFESLAKHISFRKDDATASTLEQIIVNGQAERASHRKNIKRRDGGDVRHYGMPADNELNRIVRQRLQTLTKRWKSATKNAEKGAKK